MHRLVKQMDNHLAVAALKVIVGEVAMIAVDHDAALDQSEFVQSLIKKSSAFAA
jgi:hypothetical protein